MKDSLPIHYLLAMSKSFSVKSISTMSAIALTFKAPITRILRGSIVGWQIMKPQSQPCDDDPSGSANEQKSHKRVKFPWDPLSCSGGRSAVSVAVIRAWRLWKMRLSNPETKIRWPFISNPRRDNVSSTELVPLSPIETDTQNQPKSTKSPEVPLSWTPWPLRKLIIVGFVICFVLLAVVLAILFGVSKHNRGLTSSKENLHYLWTYGPTAGKSDHI